MTGCVDDMLLSGEDAVALNNRVDTAYFSSCYVICILLISVLLGWQLMLVTVDAGLFPMGSEHVCLC